MTEFALTFTVELLEDMHTGTGVGRLGIVDDTQSRNQQGDPVVWASTLRGLLREAGDDYLLMRKAVEADVTNQRELLDKLLGKDGNAPGRAIVRSLTLDSKKDQGEYPKFTVWNSTAREVHSRRPDDGTLR